jgi:hypothetical protein
VWRRWFFSPGVAWELGGGGGGVLRGQFCILICICLTEDGSLYFYLVYSFLLM